MGGRERGSWAMREAGDWHEALLKVEYSFQSEQPDLSNSITLERNPGNKVASGQMFQEALIAQWWPSVQKAKIAGQPTSPLLLRWWWSWKVLAMRTLRADLRARPTFMDFAFLFALISLRSWLLALSFRILSFLQSVVPFVVLGPSTTLQLETWFYKLKANRHDISLKTTTVDIYKNHLPFFLDHFCY